ncbi:AMP-binding protein [Tessaracoccus flavus]|uniref:AMP-dependent synthetase n=1 Tax=Tessaracoccus flavus TaxID=1610493 RepID=A0A1Q2CG52_9ACTN|nr:AMP-binding protein [Tessaracoccus flavus]AQP45025.1 AMP-dependent synthetase [Tessaracoccus flavus]SDY58848.1 acetyl-CoA synthetase [Tessaracoccus flavus]
MSDAAAKIRLARDYLLDQRGEGDSARAGFRWPELTGSFNWAIDWFDAIGRGRHDQALWIRDEEGADEHYSYDDMVQRSDRLAAWLESHGVGKGDVVMLMLGNQVELWDMMLAVMKLGAVILPTAQALQDFDVADRVPRAGVRVAVANPADEHKFDGVADLICITTGPARGRWLSMTEAANVSAAPREVVTTVDDPVLYYFTSGTTKDPKLVVHTQLSYPVGHLSTMYFLGVRPGDVHLNISSPGWGKHAWSSFFSPWLAEATVFSFNYSRFDAAVLLRELEDAKVTTFCAPPTVWRMMIQANLGERPSALREIVGAGEPLNPEVIRTVEEAWGLTIRDGYGQTETTCTIGNAPGEQVKPGSMGKVMPGVDVRIIDPETGETSDHGEITLPLEPWPYNLMSGYFGGAATAQSDGRYHSGDLVSRDRDGYITYLGRTDDVFKASDYKISPFELESVLIEHPAVVEAAVVPAPDPVRLAVPKAYVVLAAGFEATAETAYDILRHARDRLAPYLRVRRIEFAELPKTISGKVRRVVLRAREHDSSVEVDDYRYEHFPELRKRP